jgi:prophage antirepressor-like protein
LKKENDKNEQLVNTDNNSFYYFGHKFIIIDIDGAYYFRAKDIAEYFGYADTDGAVRDHIVNKYKFNFKDLLNKNSFPGKMPGNEFIEKKKSNLYIRTWIIPICNINKK